MGDRGRAAHRRAAGLAAVVGEIGRLPMVAGRRLQLAAERSGVTAFLLRRWRNAAEAAAEREPAERRGDPLAGRRRCPRPTIRRGEPGIGRPRWRVELLRVPRRRAGALGSGGRRCDGSCMSFCRTGRSTGCAAPARVADRADPPRRLTRRRSRRWSRPAGGALLAAVNPAAAAAGLAPGMPLADALSFLPGLATAPAEPAADAAALTRLAEWCGRYSPWTAPDGADGVKIEITGCAHLWGGEAALAADLARPPRRGKASRTASRSPARSGAAWALARFAAEAGRPALPAPATERAALAPLPVEALRLDPATVAGLRRVGLRRVGELYPMPRDALARRFGESVAQRLDQALDALPEPLSPLGEAPVRRVRLSFAEPIADPADLARAIERLAADLARGWRARASGRAGSTSPFTGSTAGSSISASAPPGRAATRAISPACSRRSSTRSIPVSGSRT